MSFLTSLDPVDLARLRTIVRRVHFKNMPERHQSDREVDKLIEAIGPTIQEKLIKALVDSGRAEKRSIHV